jgi:selenophosphate synthase
MCIFLYIELVKLVIVRRGYSLIENFWETIEEYRQLGFDPLRWIPTCSNEIDSYVLQSSLEKIKRSTIKIISSWFDAFYYTDGKSPELTRRVYKFDNPQIEREVEIKRALAMFRIHTQIGEDSILLSQALQRFLKCFHSKTMIKKSTTTLTAYPEAQFVLLDYIASHRGNKVGYITASNSTTQITDPTQRPESEIHSNIALTNAMENLNLLGCTSGFKVFPIYDAPTEEILDKIRKNLDAFTSRYNLAMDDYSSLKIGKLFFGTTAIANTLKELPTRYDQVEEGMQIIISNKFGAMPALSLYMLTEMDPSNLAKLEQNNILWNYLSSAKDEVIKHLSEPHFSFGKIISKYCPDFGTTFDKHAHITAVHPVTTDGIFALAKFAGLTNSHVVINEIPMMYEEIARFATKEFLIENATASSNRCHLIVVTRDLASSIIGDLRKHNFEPAVIGFIAKKERPFVVIEKDISQYVASKAKLAKLNPIA